MIGPWSVFTTLRDIEATEEGEGRDQLIKQLGELLMSLEPERRQRVVDSYENTFEDWLNGREDRGHICNLAIYRATEPTDEEKSLFDELGIGP